MLVVQDEDWWGGWEAEDEGFLHLLQGVRAAQPGVISDRARRLLKVKKHTAYL